MKSMLSFCRLSVILTLAQKVLKPPILMVLFRFMAFFNLSEAEVDHMNPVLPPVAVCKNISVQLGSGGTVTISGSDVDGGSYDPDGIITKRTVSPSTFNCSQTGSNSVVLTVTDNEGLTSTCNAIVTVEDKTPPVINYKPFTLVLGSSGTATIVPADIDNGTYDNCGSVTLSVSPDTFTCSDLGQKTVTLTALDLHGNSSSRNLTINITSTLDIVSMSLSTCDMSPTLALFEADTEGGDGNYSYFWRGLNAATKPFMVIIPFPPSLQFSNTTILESPFFNNTMANGYYDIRLVVTDGKGCADSSEIKINKTGAIFNNQTMRHSQACEGEIKTHSVNYKSDAVYSWTVTNGTILTSNPDTSRISIRWNLGVVQGRIVTTIREPNILFSGGQCESTIIDTVTITPVPTPVFSNPVTSVCMNSTNTYTLTGSYAYQSWTVIGGVITSGGNISDNFITVRWGSGPAGSISVSAGNNSSCTGSVLLNVAVSNLSGSITSKTDVKCNGGSDGSVTAAAVSGTGQPPYSYSLDGGAFQSSGTFGSLTAGAYSISIRDASLCSIILPVTIITQPSLALAGSIAVTNIICFGDISGACNLTVTGGTSPYTYLWSNGALTEDINNISAGNYSVTITDSHGCTIVINTAVTQPPITLNGSITSHSDVSVYGGNDGSVTISGSGGTSPYEYRLDGGNYQASGTFGSLTAGTYTITVRDAAMCTYDVTATITQPWIPLTANIITQINVSCQGGSIGSVIVAGWGGTLPYLYSIDGGAFQASGTFGSLSAGTYTITVRDAALDIFNIPVTITEAEALDVTVSGEDVHCFGGNSGSVTATVTGGTGPYTYSWNSLPEQTTPTATGLTAGTYTVTITDANGCTATNNVTISQPSADMVVSITQDNIMCSGGTTGSATAAVTGGLEPYTFSWNTTPEQTKETATDLSAGPYTITITDSYGCIKTGSVNITEPQHLSLESSVTPASCPDSNDGSINLTIIGGTGPFNVLWSDGLTGLTRSGIKQGTYTAAVTDKNNCGETIVVNVEFTFTFGCLVIPQVITPNNDGFNDVWRIKNIDLYPNAEVRIFSRWGKMIFSSKNLSDNPWNGTISGKPAPTDSYHYILYLNDGSEPKSGVISVIR
ncbi:MAG: gliding motility-associated C-terminal domain-containing protein [Bacteroidia bacterium]|nr:gliding motility-associated C-terminal domain-containing protein [Bacteroidia bacterium]